MSQPVGNHLEVSYPANCVTSVGVLLSYVRNPTATPMQDVVQAGWIVLGFGLKLGLGEGHPLMEASPGPIVEQALLRLHGKLALHGEAVGEAVGDPAQDIMPILIVVLPMILDLIRKWWGRK